MSQGLFLVSLLVAMLAAVGYGIVAVLWSIGAAISTRVSKPNQKSLYKSFVWTLISWVVMNTLVVVTVSTNGGEIAAVLFLAMFPVAILAAIGGACYGSANR